MADLSRWMMVVKDDLIVNGCVTVSRRRTTLVMAALVNGCIRDGPLEK